MKGFVEGKTHATVETFSKPIARCYLSAACVVQGVTNHVREMAKEIKSGLQRQWKGWELHVLEQLNGEVERVGDDCFRVKDFLCLFSLEQSLVIQKVPFFMQGQKYLDFVWYILRNGKKFF